MSAGSFVDTLKQNEPSEVVFDCIHCTRPIAIDARAAGMDVDCPYCAKPLKVPELDEARPPASSIAPEPEPEAPAAPAPDPPGERRETDRAGANSGESAIPAAGSSLPPPRGAGAKPKASAEDADELAVPPGGPASQGRPVTVGHAPVPTDQEDAILAGIARGDIEILKARKVRGKIVFGCPFCAKPIEIKPRQQGTEMVCTDCSGKMRAPDLSANKEAESLSGHGGKAGEGGVVLPGRKPPSKKLATPAAAVPSRPAPAAPDAPPGEDAPDEEPSLDKRREHRFNDGRVAKFVPREQAEAGFDLENAWKSYGDPSQKTIHWLRRMRRLSVFGMLGLMAAAIAASVFWWSKIKRDGEPAESPAAAGPAVDGGPTGEVGLSDAQKAITVIRKLRNASSITERLEFVRNPEETADHMRRFYSRYASESEIPPLNALSYIESDVGGVKMARLTTVDRAGRESRNYYFEITPDGKALLDWDSAVGYSDMDIVDFANNPPPRAVQMRVLVRPDDYYNYEFSNALVYSSFKIMDLRGRGNLYGYAMVGSDTDKRLKGLHTAAAGDNVDGYINVILKLVVPDGVERREPMLVKIEEIVESEGWLIP